MISQFFVLSQRGDNIVFRDYRGEVPKGSAEIFFRKVKFWKGDEEEEAPPVFGYILTSEIDGTIQMKSYLTGNPKIHLALNEDLSIGRNGASGYDYRSSAGGGVVILDDCNFHESVHLDSFDVDRTLALVPPDGEFPVMNYRMTQEFKPPFRINALIEEAGMYKAEVILKIRADFPSSVTANTISVQMPLPSYTTRVSFELEAGAVGQTTDLRKEIENLRGP
ncbi:AP-4 complex subunit mu [Iris pallida]|uniref:AP-4 complex subunit mu n=1 Tax=Iris pallida TaxID=29817 RepID=A0AAX6HCJ7_IRIPA|nr:AP-4 complex subunit mu [Iris pallida]